ncbi:hypothetical protein BX616_001879 [Lobosporangium transversale]|nr:hypothetical protein BX616_001879 [Lobosporangium transversale]
MESQIAEKLESKKLVCLLRACSRDCTATGAEPVGTKYPEHDTLAINISVPSLYITGSSAAISPAIGTLAIGHATTGSYATDASYCPTVPKATFNKGAYL